MTINPPSSQLTVNIDDESEDPAKEKRNQFWRYARYAAIGLATNVVLWGMTLTYLKTAKPVYTSGWAIIVPGAGSGVSVNLPEIGQASSSSSSPFGSASMDPRANYQFLITNESVLEEAAIELKIPAKQLGKPKVKLVDNTSIMEFEVTGPTAKDAQMRSNAIYNAFQSKLTRLRLEEVAKREQGSQGTLVSSREKLQQAQNNLSEYKAQSGLSSGDQVKDLSNNIEQLRKQRAESYAQAQQSTARLEQLSSDLDVEVPEASQAFLLQADQLFQQYLKDYNESSSTLVVIQAKWGDNHPFVVKEATRRDAARTALLGRASSLVGRKITLVTLQKLLIKTESGSSRESLFRDLVALQSEQQGIVAQNQALTNQIGELEDRLQGLVQKQAKLDKLQRELQIAEAVFASTLAKLDLGKSDIFISYPMTQIIAEPTLPDEKTSPKPSIVFVGAGIASVLITTGLVMLWWRKETANYIKAKIKSSPDQILDS
ncbi:hypothetical protein H6F42_02425 [Pseudanabaena sp. FACHB-1998]|uniref:GumC family protein n=1 Tax=Pseudanabaena sp. FACHB-1998 TaxID=2692858 RepID=UPI00167FF492|nr:hypothetical protein [Pseudanabaena sp. FACHB-1998]MBD2175774.1 hypothetical protein [Pseudanabaena sp. FACHB-1998]